MKNISSLLVVFISTLLLCGYVDLREGTSTGSKMMLARRTIAGIIEQNSRNISNLQDGMTKDEVLAAMENKPLIAYQNGEEISVQNPSKTETLVGKEKSIYVLYYMTESRAGDYTVTDDKLTPIVFENNKLIGIGWGFLDDIMKKYEIESK